MMIGKHLLCGVVVGGVALSLGTLTAAAVADESNDATIAMGPVAITAPEDWQRKQPRVRIIAYEYAVPAAEGDEHDGRMTVMLAGGSIDDNVQRWYGQFKQPDGGDTSKVARVEEKEFADHTVHLVDVSGTYLDRRGPVAPAVSREGYRMLAAIVETKQGNYFIKFYGPQNTVKEQEAAFMQMIEGMESR